MYVFLCVKGQGAALLEEERAGEAFVRGLDRQVGHTGHRRVS